MLFAACAMIKPKKASAKFNQSGLSATAAASSQPIRADVAVMVNTAARVMISHLLTTSISLSEDKLAVSMTSFQIFQIDT